MGLIIDRTEWIDSVYLIELTDPVQGGENGISNIQAKQLANRTRYLKALFDLEHTESGNHAIADEHVAEGAGIAESKLALIHTTSEIKGVSEDVRDKNEDVEYRLDDIIGIKGSMVSALGKAIPLSWRNSERGFEFDMFAAVFTYLDEEPVTITRTIVGDDSVDVSSTAKMVVGHTYVISDGNGYGTEVVKVKQILTSERFIATEKLKATRGSGILSQTSWMVGTGKAEARNGGVLVSKTIKILQNHATGKFIARVKSNGAIVTPYYQAPGDSAWVRGVYLESVQRVAGYSDITYQVAGGPIILRLEVTAPSGITAEIDHMCVLPFQQGGVAEAIKQPVITSPVALESNVILTGPITWTAFRSLYGIAQKAVEVEIATDSAFTDVVWSFTGTNEVSSPITVDALLINTAYYARVRQQDVEDVWSRYSDTVYFSTGEVLGVVTRPTNVFPSNGLTDIDKNVTLTSSVFSAEPSDTHVASQWQIASDAGFTTILHDSGEVASLTSYRVADGILTEDTTYYWRVRYKGEALGWSEYSSSTMFVTYAVQIENLFSTTLYTGNSSTQMINNGIDLAGEGGLVWVKSRSNAYNNWLVDTTRGLGKSLSSNTTGSEEYSIFVTATNSNGFSISNSDHVNASGGLYSSWTFRKAPKFFDIVQYTGDGVAGRQIAHNLGVEPGMVIVKSVNQVNYNWMVYTAFGPSGQKNGCLNLPNAFDSGVGNASVTTNTGFVSTVSTTTFTVTSGNSGVGGVNYNGYAYIAYLFAHDPSEDGVIQCGSYIGSSTDWATSVNLGWEPQYVLIKNATTSGNWNIFDNVRGITGNTGNDQVLFSNLSNAEESYNLINTTPTGFEVANSSRVGGAGNTCIYLAIRAPEA